MTTVEAIQRELHMNNLNVNDVPGMRNEISWDIENHWRSQADGLERIQSCNVKVEC